MEKAFFKAGYGLIHVGDVWSLHSSVFFCNIWK